MKLRLYISVFVVNLILSGLASLVFEQFNNSFSVIGIVLLASLFTGAFILFFSIYIKSLNVQKRKNTHLEKSKQLSVDTLMAGLIHEINTPLTYIKGNFEMVLYEIKKLHEDSTKEYLLNDSQKIIDGIKRIEIIVESMREVSNTSDEEKSVFNLYDTLITSLVVIYNRVQHISNVYINDELFHLEMEKNSFKYLFYGQKQRLEQVWIIILNNALDELIKIDEFEKRELRIYIDKNDDKIEIAIKDNAGGINQEILETIFDPFISTKEHCGVGVGLNIAHNIINEQNGSIEAYNEKDGAVFKVVLQEYNEI